MAMAEEHDERDERRIECPKCGTPCEVEPVTVLRPGDSVLPDLFAGTLNMAVCAQCGARFSLTVPILFRDDEEQYLVYFLPRTGAGEWREAETEMAEVTESIFADEPDLEAPTCRLALRRSEFIEKIALHFRGLDDRVVEYVKYQLLHHPSEEFGLDPFRHRLLFDFSQDEDENLAFLVFDRETNEATARTHLPMDVYREVAEMIGGNQQLSEELDLLFPGAYVSLERLSR